MDEMRAIACTLRLDVNRLEAQREEIELEIPKYGDSKAARMYFTPVPTRS
jgi:hypothetical protein